MDYLLDINQWNVALAFFFPLVVALIKQSGWSDKANAVVSAVTVAVVAAVSLAAQGELTLENWGASAVLLFTVSLAAYRGLWSPTGADSAIKDATSFVKGE